METIPHKTLFLKTRFKKSSILPTPHTVGRYRGGLFGFETIGPQVKATAATGIPAIEMTVASISIDIALRFFSVASNALERCRKDTLCA